MKLSEAQVNSIRQVLVVGGIAHERLHEDILDHLCCVLEARLTSGGDFARCLEEAIAELAPDGLQNIQNETIFLLNSKKIMIMKKFMYAVGLVTTASMTMGLTFKILHLPGAEELFNFGFFGFALIFLPMVMVDRFKQKIYGALSEKLRVLFGVVSAVAIGMSVMFKIFHYGNADLMLLVGISIFSFGFLPFLFFNLYKKSLS